MKLVLQLPWKVLAQSNHRLVRGKGKKRLVLASEYRNKKAAAEALLVGQVKRRPAIPEGPVRVEIHFYEPDRRKRDPSNLLKMIEDALTGVAYTDDSQITELEWRRSLNRSTPGADITITATD